MAAPLALIPKPPSDNEKHKRVELVDLDGETYVPECPTNPLGRHARRKGAKQSQDHVNDKVAELERELCSVRKLVSELRSELDVIRLRCAATAVPVDCGSASAATPPRDTLTLKLQEYEHRAQLDLMDVTDSIEKRTKGLSSEQRLELVERMELEHSALLIKKCRADSEFYEEFEDFRRTVIEKQSELTNKVDEIYEIMGAEESEEEDEEEEDTLGSQTDPAGGATEEEQPETRPVPEEITRLPFKERMEAIQAWRKSIAKSSG